MNQNKDNFYMILPSNSSPLIHPDNCPSEFIVELQNPIYLEGKWEVGLLDFTFIYFNFPVYGKAKIEYTTSKDISYDVTVTVDKEKQQISVNENPIVSVMNNLLKFYCDCEYNIEFESAQIATKFGFASKSFNKRTGVMTMYLGLLFDFKDVIDKVKMKITYTEVKHHTFQFQDDLIIPEVSELSQYIMANCSTILKRMALKKGYKFQFELLPNVKSIKFDKLLTKTLALEKQEYTPADKDKDNIIYATGYPKVLKYHQQMFIYSSLVEPIIVGDVNVPLMKAIWIDKFDEDEVVQIIMDHPMYLPIATSCINNIEVNIRDDSGKLINFPKDTKTHLTLHFRKSDGQS